MTEKETKVHVDSAPSAEVRRIFDVYEALVCKRCDKTFDKKTLYKAHAKAHERDDHNYEYKDKRKTRPERSRPHVCVVCDQRFTEKKNLLKHLRHLHGNFNEAEKLQVKKIRCPEGNCLFACRQIRELRTHIEKHHDLKILKDTLQFASEESFLRWKKEEEDNSVSSFVSFRQQGYLRDGTLKRVLLCHRTGRYVPKGKGKHRIKSRGSCKIDGTCPAAMEIVQFPDGHLTVFYYKTHLGHSQDVAHLQLSREERAKLSERIEQGFSLDAILEDVKDSIDPVTGKVKRIHLLSRKDLYNIMKSSNNNNNGAKKAGKGGNDAAVEDEEEGDGNGDGWERKNEESAISKAKTSDPGSASGDALSDGAAAPLRPSNPCERGGTRNKRQLDKTSEGTKGKAIAARLAEKMDQIHGLLPACEFLTPKQYETICRKLDGVIGLFDAARARCKRATLKKAAAAAKGKSEGPKENRNLEEQCPPCAPAPQYMLPQQPVYEAPPLYAYVYTYN